MGVMCFSVGNVTTDPAQLKDLSISNGTSFLRGREEMAGKYN